MFCDVDVLGKQALCAARLNDALFCDLYIVLNVRYVVAPEQYPELASTVCSVARNRNSAILGWYCHYQILQLFNYNSRFHNFVWSSASNAIFLGRHIHNFSDQTYRRTDVKKVQTNKQQTDSITMMGRRKVGEVEFRRSSYADLLFLPFRNSAVVVVVRNIAELRKYGQK
jgi:hypothetical protein